MGTCRWRNICNLEILKKHKWFIAMWNRVLDIIRTSGLLWRVPQSFHLDVLSAFFLFSPWGMLPFNSGFYTYVTLVHFRMKISATINISNLILRYRFYRFFLHQKKTSFQLVHFTLIWGEAKKSKVFQELM